MPSFKEIKEFFDNTVNINSCVSDYSNNGIQVEASTEVTKIAFGVDGCLDLFQEAANWDADMIFVHHGISWGDGFKRFDGVIGKELKILFKNDISLYAAHLPLDGHPRIGHNALIAKELNLQNAHQFAEYCGLEIGMIGQAMEENGISAKDLAKTIANKLNSDHVQIFNDLKRPLKTIAVISGGGGKDGIAEAARVGADCLITGEVGHSCFHLIKELGITVITAGHYQSEIPGVLAVMNKAKEQFGSQIECKFFDIPTGL
ncbi:Nif3-like dinuclear metal center hexameric protein [Lentisphaerota bacterium WC36G]|nr:Nif3-like dinuclear metal center hexameric protein [Lentisphaerae bacterium WC36]